MGDRGTPFAEWSAAGKKWRSFLWKRKNAGLLSNRSGRGVLNINGKLCLQRKACWHDVGRRGHKYTYLSIRQPGARFDICAWKLPDGRFLILPKKLTGFSQTTFNPEESESLGTASSSHYYRQHIERWSLLGRPRRARG